MSSSPPRSTTAHKFGGSSLRDAARIGRVVDIVMQREGRQVVVVSAMGGVTDALIELVELAGSGGETDAWRQRAAELERRHVATAEQLLGEHSGAACAQLAEDFAGLRELLHAQSLVGAVSPDLMGLIAGLGEIWSSRIVESKLRSLGCDSSHLDAREVLVVRGAELGATVDWEETRRRMAARCSEPGTVTVVPGFVARTIDGRVTNLGRNGSDYSCLLYTSPSPRDRG